MAEHSWVPWGEDAMKNVCLACGVKMTKRNAHSECKKMDEYLDSVHSDG